MENKIFINEKEMVEYSYNKNKDNILNFCSGNSCGCIEYSLEGNGSLLIVKNNCNNSINLTIVWGTIFSDITQNFTIFKGQTQSFTKPMPEIIGIRKLIAN